MELDLQPVFTANFPSRGTGYRPPGGVASVWGDPLLNQEYMAATTKRLLKRLSPDERARFAADVFGARALFWDLVERDLELELGALDERRVRPGRDEECLCRLWDLGVEQARGSLVRDAGRAFGML